MMCKIVSFESERSFRERISESQATYNIHCHCEDETEVSLTVVTMLEFFEQWKLNSYRIYSTSNFINLSAITNSKCVKVK